MAKKKLKTFLKECINKSTQKFTPAWESRMEENIRSCFQDQWADSGEMGKESPDLLFVSLSVTPCYVNQKGGGYWTLSATATYWINYHNKYCCGKAETQQPWTLGIGITQECFEEELAGIFEKLNKTLPGKVGHLPETYSAADCRKFQAVRDYLTETDVPAKHRDLFRHIIKQVSGDMSEIEDKALVLATKLINRKIKTLGSLPTGAATAVPAKCEISLSNNGQFSVNVCASIYMDFPAVCWKTKVSITQKTPCLFDAVYYKRDDARVVIKSAIMETAEKAISEILKDFPVCKVPVETLPQSLVDILTGGEVRYGKISAGFSESRRFWNVKLCDYVGHGTIEFTFGSSKSNTPLVMHLPELQKAEMSPIKLGSKKGVAPNMVAFNKFCEAVGELYETFSDKRVKTMPELDFVLQRTGIAYCNFEETSVSVKELFSNSATHDKTIRARLMELFQMVADETVVQQNKAAEQAVTLEKLNPSEFAALRLIAEKGELWYTAINDRLENSVLTTKVSMGPYLDNLCRTSATIGNERKYLLTFEWRHSRKHGDFRVYNTPINWVSGVFDMAKPRPFEVDEMDDMTAAGKEKFFHESLKRAGDDNALRWRTLNILERMSKQYAAEFAKTAEGESFFHSFDGDDALYARFFVESLPGCKRLAGRIFSNNNQD